MQISVVGFGNIGRIHARIEKKLGYLSSIVDIDEACGKQASKLFNVPLYRNIQEMLEQDSPDGIILAVPTGAHSLVTKEILRSRPSSLKAILMEKPMTSNLEDAYQLRQLLIQAGVKTLVGHSELYNPIVQKMFDLLSSRVIGTPKIFLFQRRSSVSNRALTSLGDIFEDLAIHDLDLFSRLIPDKELQIHCKGFYNETIINSAIVQIQVPQSNISALFLLSREYAGKIRQIEVEGTHGTLFVELLDQYLIYNLRAHIQAALQSVSISSGEGEKIKVYGEPLLEEHLDFHSLITGDSKTPRVGIDDAIRALRLVEACRSSVELNRSVQMNLGKKRA